MVEVLSTKGAVAVWMCPDCGHGSPDRRDERAHLDAHRQLRAFFEEWESGADAGAVTEKRRSRRFSYLGIAAAVLVMLVISVSVYSRINTGSDVPPTSAGPFPAVVRDAAPPSAPPATSPPRSVAGSDARPPAAAPSPTAAPPARSSPPVTPVAPAAVTTTAPPSTTPPPREVDAAPTPAPPAHLLSVCLLGICVALL